MTFNFCDLRMEVFESATLSTDFFAESGAALAFDDGRVVELTVKVRYRSARETDRDTHKESETIEVVIGRDPTSELGGIDRPRTGMRLRRSPARDPDRGPYTYLGVVVAETPHYWRLEFSRKRTKSQGRAT